MDNEIIKILNKVTAILMYLYKNNGNVTTDWISDIKWLLSFSE